MATKNTKATKSSKSVKSTRAAKLRKGSMMAVAFNLMRRGKTNEQVLAILCREHGLKENHRHYAAWFRSALCRKMAAAGESKRAIEKIRNGAHGKKYSRGMTLKEIAAR